MADEKTAEALAAEHSKTELAAAAAVEGVEVKSKDTKADIAGKLASAGDAPGLTRATPGHPGPMIVGTVRQRSDEDALLGHWVDVVSGEYQGKFGQFFDVAESDKDGIPKTALVRTRDAQAEVIRVAYGDLRPSERTGGR